MRTLPQDKFQQAREFVETQARAVDRALFRHHFDKAPAAGVCEALAAYQNDDGGFGHALEPDFRLPDSSALATTVAFQYFIETGTPSSNEHVQRGIRYLVETFDPSVCGWQSTPPQVNDYPRAPWWNYDEAGAGEYLRTGWANPSAEIVGYLHAYCDLAPAALLAEVTQKARSVLERRANEIEGHDYLCFVRMAEHVPEPHKGNVWGCLRKQARAAIATTPEQWQGYSIRPLWAVSEPTSPLMEVLGDAVSEHLDFEIDQQQADGSWYPFWTWGQFEREWETAKLEWQGQLTVKMLRCLDSFGRIAES